MRKYMVGKEQKHLVVSRRTHAIIMQYANEKGLTMIEATHNILRAGIIKLLGLEFKEGQYS